MSVSRINFENKDEKNVVVKTTLNNFIFKDFAHCLYLVFSLMIDKHFGVYSLEKTYPINHNALNLAPKNSGVLLFEANKTRNRLYSQVKFCPPPPPICSNVFLNYIKWGFDHTFPSYTQNQSPFR
jgi:hypothetical protein